MNFKRLFQPETLAVVGVSLSNDRHPANVIYHKNNLRQKVKVFPVNDRGGCCRGKRSSPNLGHPREDRSGRAWRPGGIHARHSEGLHRGGDRGAVVISGGFAESSRKDLQDRMIALAKEADFPFLGPNCLGVYSPPYVDTFFLPSERIVRPDKGRVAIVSQSGGFLVDQMIKFTEEGLAYPWR